MLLEKLKLKFKELQEQGRSEDSILIGLKEMLQQYILNFIYTSKKYSHLTMYGGTVLRIGYDLPRMSEDLDFQTSILINFDEFAEEIKKYFKDNYSFNVEVKHNNSNDNNTRVLFINFDILKDFGFKQIKSTKLKIRVGINYFTETSKFIKDTIPGGKGTELAYTIKTYPLSTLMASKTVAFLKRDARGIGDILTNVKPRDVYDMMWYMDKGILPDLEYLQSHGIAMDTFLDFRDKVKLRANKIEDNAFINDLSQFFYNKNEFESWLFTWRQKFMQLLDSYKVYEIIDLKKILILEDYNTESKSIYYRYTATENHYEYEDVHFKVTLTDYWFRFRDIKIGFGYQVEEIENKIEKTKYELSELDYQYIGLFYNKIKDYIKRNKNVVFQNKFETKVIRATASDLKPKYEIYLDKRLLEKIDFEELL